MAWAQATEERLDASLVAPADVGGGEHIVHGHQGVAGIDGLLLQRIQPGPGDLPGPEGTDQGGLVHDGAAGGVDEVRSLLHQAELTVTDGVDGLGGGGHMEGDVVAFGKDLVPVLHQLDVIGRPSFLAKGS